MSKKARPVLVKKAKLPTWVACGFDISMSSVAGAARGWDKTLKQTRGPVFVERRWSRGTDYFERLAVLAKPETLIQELLAELHMTPELYEIHIGVEEPFPFGMAGKSNATWIKQQAQLTGGFLGGLARYGYANVYEVNNQLWKGLVARDLGVGLRDPDLKFKTKDWAREKYQECPDWPHLLNSPKHGIIPQPPESKAKPYQPDDRYDALGIENWVEDGIRSGEFQLLMEPRAQQEFPKMPVKGERNETR